MQERKRARGKQKEYLNELKFLPSLNLTANFAKPNRDLQLIKFKHLSHITGVPVITMR